MAGHTTKPYKNTLSGSVGAGMGSLFTPGGKKYYILEHKVSSKYHRAGESQEIIVDNIELGRDSHCQVRFDESFKTVSRHHAAIVKDGDMWKLVQISKTNSTFLNGHPVKTEWYLQNGDEIQLSVNGPKLGFILPTGKKSTVGSIGLTRRLSLFRQQALRPYKTAITTLACLLVLISIGGGYVIYQQGKQLNDNILALADAKEVNAKNERLITEQRKLLENQGGLLDSLKKIKPKVIVKYVENGNTLGQTGSVDMSVCHPYVYHITATVFYNGEEVSSWLGTGFQLEEGKFVTARHVCSTFYSNSFYIDNGVVYPREGVNPIDVYKELMINVLAQQGNIQIKFKCVSPNDTYLFTNNQINEVGKYDQIHTLKEPYRVYKIINGKVAKDANGNPVVLAQVPAGTNIRIGAGGAVDFAYVQNNLKKGLKSNKRISTELKQGTQLYVLGYPHGWGKGKPIFSTAICSQNGLSEELGGTIMVSNNNTEGGNSGGPIFIKTQSGWEVVAIVSGSNAAKGRFVPISVIP